VSNHPLGLLIMVATMAATIVEAKVRKASKATKDLASKELVTKLPLFEPPTLKDLPPEK
jgi:hypothetical protein